MSAGHTPGPWTAKVEDNGDNLVVTGKGGEHVVSGCGCCGSPWTDEKCAQANARLIAAAPELYEALEAMLDEHDDGHGISHSTANMAMDVIAKALGHD